MPQQTSLSHLWKVRDGDQLRWRCWDDEHVVFDPLSGDTHVLNEIAALALKRLDAGALDCSDLSERIAAELDLQADEAMFRHMERLLLKFEDLGLIEPQHQ